MEFKELLIEKNAKIVLILDLKLSFCIVYER